MCDECYEKIDKYGTKRRYKKGTKNILHCLTEPAIQYKDGNWSWWKNGIVHREDGPARNEGGQYYFWLEGEEYSEQDYWVKIKEYRKEKINSL